MSMSSSEAEVEAGPGPKEKANGVGVDFTAVVVSGFFSCGTEGVGYVNAMGTDCSFKWASSSGTSNTSLSEYEEAGPGCCCCCWNEVKPAMPTNVSSSNWEATLAFLSGFVFGFAITDVADLLLRSPSSSTRGPLWAEGAVVAVVKSMV